MSQLIEQSLQEVRCQEMPADKNYQEELAKMIKGIAKKASYKLFSRDLDDIEQDLWVKVLETEKRKGHQLDLNLAAKVCYDYIKDMIDYDQRRNHSTVDLSGTEDNEISDNDFLGTLSDKGNYEVDLMLKDLYDKYPKGSKERIFLDFWGNESGAMPNTDAIPDSSRTNDGYTENALAKMLGYASQSSGGYRKFKDKMIQIIKDYYEI